MEDLKNSENIKNGICFIVGAGDYTALDFAVSPHDYVIAADGGLTYVTRCGLTADLVIGDFDSLESTEQLPEHQNVIQLNKMKDDTDTFAAAREGIKLGYKEFHLYCCTGGRFDHTLANMQLLAYLSENGMHGRLVGRDYFVTAITNGCITLEPCQSGYISVFSHSERSIGVCLKGLKYELDNAVLTNTFPVGVSNEFIGCQSSVSVERGTLVIVCPITGGHIVRELK